MRQGRASRAPLGVRRNSGSKLSDFVDGVLPIASWRMSVTAIAEKVSVSWLKSPGSTPSNGQTRSSRIIETGPAMTAAMAPSNISGSAFEGVCKKSPRAPRQPASRFRSRADNERAFPRALRRQALRGAAGPIVATRSIDTFATPLRVRQRSSRRQRVGVTTSDALHRREPREDCSSLSQSRRRRDLLAARSRPRADGPETNQASLPTAPASRNPAHRLRRLRGGPAGPASAAVPSKT